MTADVPTGSHHLTTPAQARQGTRARAGARGGGTTQTGAALARPRDYGPIQLPTFLGLTLWQFERLRRDGLIPWPGRPRGRWSRAVADDLLSRISELRKAVGTIPDLGAVRAAEMLSGRLGVEVTVEGVVELCRRGLLPRTGTYAGYPLYDGRALETFTDTAAAVDATRAGELVMGCRVLEYLDIRPSDLEHLTRSRMLVPAKRIRGRWDPEGVTSVKLYRIGDLDVLLARTDIPWEVVCATPAGRPSPLARIADGELTLAALAAIGDPARRQPGLKWKVTR